MGGWEERRSGDSELNRVASPPNGFRCYFHSRVVDASGIVHLHPVCLVLSPFDLSRSWLSRFAIMISPFSLAAQNLGEMHSPSPAPDSKDLVGGSRERVDEFRKVKEGVLDWANTF